MTGQDFQDRLDAIVADLQTTGKDKTVTLMFRQANGQPFVLQLSSDGAGVVDAGQLAAAQAFIDNLKPIANTLEAQSAPVQAASDAFKAAQTPHDAAIEAARVARVALSDTLAGDAAYQTAKADVDAARSAAAYIAAREAYSNNNVSENYSELQAAKGKYIA